MRTIILKRDSYRVYEEGKMIARFETEKEAQDFVGREEVSVSGVPYKVPLKNVKAPSAVDDAAEVMSKQKKK
jgi:hypothetical protein